ncbi:MAG: hypothetical protein A2Y79_08945 [Deltaproteobacteria bacterium RBG_13_43_22]|nr:MAG: hypothetical protein A2Y79_08945 [Deltaproteobacteria bacterium RBG_13_43_22]
MFDADQYIHVCLLFFPSQNRLEGRGLIKPFSVSVLQNQMDSFVKDISFLYNKGFFFCQVFIFLPKWIIVKKKSIIVITNRIKIMDSIKINPTFLLRLSL